MKVDLVLVATQEIENQEDFKSKLLTFLFKSIDQNLPWINHIYYLIDSNTNIPYWLNLKNITLVPKESLYGNLSNEVKENIALEFLVTNLLELSNTFIVMKDNTLITTKLNIEDFFDPATESPKYSTTMMTTKEPFKKIQEILFNYKEIFPEKTIPPILQKPIYGIQPYTKELLIKTFWSMTGGKLDKKLTAEAAYYYGLKNGIAITSYNIQEGLFSYSSAWAGIIKYDLINNPKRQIISITNEMNYSYNLITALHDTAYQWIVEGLECRLGTTPSKYVII